MPLGSVDAFPGVDAEPPTELLSLPGVQESLSAVSSLEGAKANAIAACRQAYSECKAESMAMLFMLMVVLVVLFVRGVQARCSDTTDRMKSPCLQVRAKKRKRGPASKERLCRLAAEVDVRRLEVELHDLQEENRKLREQLLLAEAAAASAVVHTRSSNGSADWEERFGALGDLFRREMARMEDVVLSLNRNLGALDSGTHHQIRQIRQSFSDIRRSVHHLEENVEGEARRRAASQMKVDKHQAELRASLDSVTAFGSTMKERGLRALRHALGQQTCSRMAESSKQSSQLHSGEAARERQDSAAQHYIGTPVTPVHLDLTTFAKRRSRFESPVEVQASVQAAVQAGSACAAAAPAASSSGAASSSADGSRPNLSRRAIVDGREVDVCPPQPCRFGTSCKKRDCMNMHPEGRSIDTNLNPCAFGRRCKRHNCFYDHPEGAPYSFTDDDATAAAAAPAAAPPEAPEETEAPPEAMAESLPVEPISAAPLGEPPLAPAEPALETPLAAELPLAPLAAEPLLAPLAAEPPLAPLAAEPEMAPLAPLAATAEPAALEPLAAAAPASAAPAAEAEVSPRKLHAPKELPPVMPRMVRLQPLVAAPQVERPGTAEGMSADGGAGLARLQAEAMMKRERAAAAQAAPAPAPPPVAALPSEEERRERAEHLKRQRAALLAKRKQEREQQLMEYATRGKTAAVDRALGAISGGTGVAVADLVGPSDAAARPDTAEAAVKMRQALTLQLRQTLEHGKSDEQISKLEEMKRG